MPRKSTNYGQRFISGLFGRLSALRFQTARAPGPRVLHDSDCAVHNEPATPNGPCDCGAAIGPKPMPDFIAIFDGLKAKASALR
jgi:hypothetical protein